MNVAIIFAAGVGRRMNYDKPKQYIEVEEKPILAYTLERFEQNHLINKIILVVSSDHIKEGWELGKE